MAEAAGLVIGGISLVALVDSASSAFDKIEAGKAYGKDYQRCALQVSLLRLRLDRWLEVVTAASQGKDFGTLEDGEMVKQLLGDIGQSINNTEMFAKRYKLSDEDAALLAVQPDKESSVISALTAKAQRLSLRRQKDASLVRKTRWALRDNARFVNLVNVLRQSIDDLETVFPASEFPAVKQQQDQLAVTEAQELVKPDVIEEPVDKDNALRLEILSSAAKDFDAALLEGLKKITPAAAQHHLFGGQYNISDQARVQNGDRIAMGAARSQLGNNYSGKFNVSGQAELRNGDDIGYGGSGGLFGPRGVFD